MTLDVDGSVISTGLRVKVPGEASTRSTQSAELLTDHGYEANTGQVLRVRNRAGNIQKASVRFLEELFDQLDATIEESPVLEMRILGPFSARM